MSDKPSLYVVERKEVVILVVLFVLVTVLAFTMGVKYGEGVGRRHGKEEAMAHKEESGIESEKTGGTLGESAAPKAEKESEHSVVLEHKEETHAEVPHQADSRNGNDKHAEKVEAKVEMKAEPHQEGDETKSAVSGATAAAVEANSDEYLLNALKGSKIEPPKGKAPHGESLPAEVKLIKTGSFVIQVGSHPTRSEAESQVLSLKAKKINAQIMPPAKEKNGEWHRVVISGFKSRLEADREAKLLKEKKQISSFFVWRFE